LHTYQFSPEPIGANFIREKVLEMEEQIFNVFLKEGGYALLFVWMLFSTMKNNKERETKYQEVIDKNQSVIEEQAKAFSSISKDVTEIKQILVGDKGDK
jgi:hypothetical protein